MNTPVWSTACLDWEERIRNRQSLIPFAPLYPSEADYALGVFKSLKIGDLPGKPTFGEVCEEWVFDFVASIFGATDPETGIYRISEFFLCISKKNSKALSLDTLIPTPSGWSTMGDLQPGDHVFGVDGKPCRVVATSPVFYDHKCYELTFSNGEKVVADAGHLWFTNALADKPGTGVGNRSKNRGQRRNRVRTTQEIVDSLYRPGDGARNHSMPMPAPIQCDPVDLPIAPYTLGAWLGDGHSAQAKITLHPDDSEILDGIRADGWPIRYASNNGSAANTYSISDGDRTQAARNVSLAAQLRALDVLNNKHIPEQYFRASYDQRLALLQGLMDTDGCVNKNGRVLYFVASNERLARDFRDLLSTFGVKNSFIERDVKCNGVPSGTSFFVQFMAFRDTLPCFRLTRKLNRMNRSDRTGNAARSRSVQIVDAREVHSVPVKCITVDAPDHQFLFGRTMLPTHNSTLAAGIMLTALIVGWRSEEELLILAPTIEVAGNSFKPAAAMVRADPELESLMHVQDNIRTITNRNNKSSLKVVAADTDTVSGKKSGRILIDELWVFGKRANADAMLREATGGLVSRPEGFIIYLTTQSDAPPAGVFKSKLEYARDVRDGRINDPRFLPVLYEYPEHLLKAEAYLDPAWFYVTNPNIGKSVSQEWLERELMKEMASDPKTRATFLAKHLNVEIGIGLRADRWAGAEFWIKAGSKTITKATVLDTSELVCIGIDGGGLDDLFGLSLIGRHRDTKRWQVWSHAWAHDGILTRRKVIAPRLKDFAAAGDLTIVDDELKDLEQILATIVEVKERGILATVSVDPAGLGEMIEALADIGVTQDDKNLYASGQGYQMMNAIKTAERMLASGRMVHDGSAMMAWCVSNLKIEPTATAIRATKQNAGDAKIDPAMAMFNAVAAMIRMPEVKRAPTYEILVVG